MMGTKEFLRTIAPDFCWCTAWDLFLMYEQLNEDASFNGFKNSLSRLTGDGVFLTKQQRFGDGKQKAKALVYLRQIASGDRGRG